MVNAAWPPGEGPRGLAVADLVEQVGADGIGLPDSPRLFGDPIVLTERLLTGSTLPLVGPCVLGMGLRHPVTTAAALRTLAAEHPGRLLAVLARGESSVRNEGLTPPGLADHLHALAEVARAVGPAATDMVLLGAASGPRTVAGTATTLGGVLIDVGAEPSAVARAVRAARDARPDAVCWLFLRACATSSAADVDRVTAPLLGSCAARLAAAPEWYGVPPDLVAELEELAAAHDYARHGRPNALAEAGSAQARAVTRDRFFLTGDRAAIAGRIAALLPPDVDGIVLAGAAGGLARGLGDTVGGVIDGLRPGSADA
ncbi:MAG TPA: hypothetical protein VGD03_00985 [Frankiaceae bacterium]